MPHEAAEREFWEETGIKVRAVDSFEFEWNQLEEAQYYPNPFSTNLHWVSPENYEMRMKTGEIDQSDNNQWGKGCEQHLGFLYLMAPVDENKMEFFKNIEETDGIAWFDFDELAELELFDNVRQEIERAVQLVEK